MNVHRYLSSTEGTLAKYLNCLQEGTIRYNKDLTSVGYQPFFDFFYCPFSTFGKNNINYIRPCQLKLNSETGKFVSKSAVIMFIMNLKYPIWSKKERKWTYSPLYESSLRIINSSASEKDWHSVKELFINCGLEFIKSTYKRVIVGKKTSFFLNPKRPIPYDAGLPLREGLESLWDQFTGMGDGFLETLETFAKKWSLEYYYHDDPEHKRKAPVLTILPVDRYENSTKLRDDNPILREVHDKWLAGELKTQQDCVDFIKTNTGTQIALNTLKLKFKKLFPENSTRLCDDDPVLSEVCSKLNSGELKYKDAIDLIESKTGKRTTRQTLYNKLKKISKDSDK